MIPKSGDRFSDKIMRHEDDIDGLSRKMRA